MLRGVRTRVVAYIGARIDRLVGVATLKQLLSLPLTSIESVPVGTQAARLKEFEGIREFFTGPLAQLALEADRAPADQHLPIDLDPGLRLQRRRVADRRARRAQPRRLDFRLGRTALETGCERGSDDIGGLERQYVIEPNLAKLAAAGHEAAVQAATGLILDPYFSASKFAWLLDAGTARENFVRQVDKNLYSVGTLSALPAIEPGQSQTVQARLFVGPQDEKVLESLATGLELVKDYGWLTILAKPLYWLMEKIHSFVGNWGWAIVLLVVLIKAAFYWLNASAYRSMAKMKAINPRIMEMRERLKSNPQQMQQEMMKIYREEKVNPIGGCLPILIQIPVFIALYWVLLSSVEMRNAPWIGWITDLSIKDPYFVLPALMTLSTLLQTWLNPTPPDPLQAKMMWIMPLLFSVMFFFFPAGLVLYWLTNNILSIAQQWMINRQLGVTK